MIDHLKAAQDALVYTESYAKEVAAKEAAEKLAMKKVISIDAGRKYFSLDQLKRIVDKASELGYSDLHLLVGNDGMRFVLDDMTVEANGKTYASDDVKKAILEGTKAYYDDPNGQALTQAEMDELHAYATAKGIGLIAAVNSPGHMDALLVAMEKLGIENPQASFDTVSKTTMDLTNEAAVNFTKALIGKYMDYFKDKSKIFNYGTDEYANDATSAQGWYYLKWYDLYGKFAEYSNSLAAMAREKGLQPMAFNDGFYYGDEDDVAFDKDVLISYWSKGWWGYNLASPQYLADKGYKFLNTNGDWYYVLGRTPETGGGYIEKAIANAAATPFRQLPSTTYPETSLPMIGSMVAVWCDTPSEEYIEKNVFDLMEAFANHNKDYFKADFTALRKAVATVPTDLDIYTPESRAALAKVLDSLNWNVSRAHQDQVDQEVATLTQALAGLKPITQVGSLAENDVKALVEDKPSLEIVEKELDFDLVERSNPDLAKGERKVIQAGVKGQGLEYVEVSALDQSRKVIATEVATEPVAEIVEVGTKEVVIPTTPSVEAPVKSDVLVNKVVPDPSTPQVISKDQPVAPGNTPTPIPAAVEKEVRSETVSSNKQLPETGAESALGLALLGAILGAAGMDLKNKKRD
ncbi:Beta-hexosaminidase [Streptococcus sp. ZB199]|nr:Beta-hexosaminidase [Streptococcus sp. ZB199]